MLYKALTEIMSVKRVLLVFLVDSNVLGTIPVRAGFNDGVILDNGVLLSVRYV